MISKPARHPGWRTELLDEREARLVMNCIDYATGDPAGLPGHQLALIIAKMARRLDELEIIPLTELPKPSGVVHAVPFVSQHSQEANAASGDCGPACVTMALRHFVSSKVAADTVNSIGRRMMGANIHRYSHTSHMIPMLRQYGLHVRNHGEFDRQSGPLTIDLLRSSIRDGKLAIVLVKYAVFQPKSDFKGGHWILVVGCDAERFLVHDPYQKTGDTGAFVEVTDELLAAAMQASKQDGNQANHGIIIWSES